MSDHLASPALLRKIDKLRELNIGAHVDLPQMVVVGDQSSGKSSLLESLTKIPFPTNTELCTRYATQITCRRDNDSRIEVTLIPGPNAAADHKRKLEDFRPPPLATDQFRAEFPKLLHEVNTCLGIRGDIHDTKATGPVFTDDVLKIEIFSPEEDYLTIIDVPGIFRTLQGATTKGDIAMVRNMVKRYIKDRRTIILAVLPANIDVSTQEILSLAEEFDPEGARTLGVLTKPDTVIERTAKTAVCNLVLGNRKPLTLGYYLVRNRGADGDEQTVEEREMLFREEPWCQLPSERLGIAALKAQLGSLLGEITKKNFPALRQEISTLYEQTEKDLAALGAERETEQQQRMFLSSIAGRFQALVTSALLGQYAHDDAFDKMEQLRLSTIIVNRADALKDEFAKYGHVWEYDVAPVSSGQEALRYERELESEPEPVPECDEADNDKHESESDDEYDEVDSSSSTDITDTCIADGLSDLIHEKPDLRGPKHGIRTWIQNLHHKYRGPELCSFGGTIISSAFREQSSRWEPLAKAFVSQCILDVHGFIRTALALLCPAGLDDEIWSSIADEVTRRYWAGLERAAFLVRAERSLNPYTLRESFFEELADIRAVRMDKKAMQWKPKHSAPAEARPPVKNNGDYRLDEIHDILSAYCKVATDRFLDNLYLQAVDYCLLNGDETPLGVFSQEWVIGLSADQLEMLAGDSPSTRGQRQRLLQKRAGLLEAVKILRG